MVDGVYYGLDRLTNISYVRADMYTYQHHRNFIAPLFSRHVNKYLA